MISLKVFNYNLYFQDLEDHKLGSTSDLKPSDLEDGSIIIVGSKQVQVLDLVTESYSIEVTKSSVVSCSVPRKRAKVSIDISSPEILIMPEPDIDHQVINFK